MFLGFSLHLNSLMIMDLVFFLCCCHGKACVWPHLIHLHKGLVERAADWPVMSKMTDFNHPMNYRTCETRICVL